MSPVELAQLVITNPWIGIINLVLALSAIIAAYIFYRRTKVVKKLLYSRKSVTVFTNISEHISDLTVSHADTDINSLTITKLLFWNGGTVTVHDSDIADADPVVIRSSRNVKILSASIDVVDNKANKFDVRRETNEAITSVDFDFIEKREGLTFVVIHTGTKSDDIFMDGTVIGTGKVRYKKQPGIDYDNDIRVPFTLILAVAGVIGASWLFDLTGGLVAVATVLSFITSVIISGGVGTIYERRKSNALKRYKEEIAV